MKKILPGLNIQHPISRLILEGKKTIETRTYPMPEKFLGKEMALIETPGKSGSFSSRIVGIVVFGKSFKYQNESEFYSDKNKHFVTPESPWRWNSKKEKWGWPIISIEVLGTPLKAPLKKGIRYTKDVPLF